MKPILLQIIIVYLLWAKSIVIAEEVDEIESGSFLFLSGNEEISEDNMLLGNKGKDSKSECKDERLTSFLFSLQIFNPESVITLATKNKLDKICSNISKTIDKMQSYLKTCYLLPEQETYSQLLNGVITLHKKLCTSDPYHKTFMEFKKCYSQLHSEFDSCNGPADWSDNSDSKIVCKAYEDIADCYYIKISVLCGTKAADVFKELVNSVINSVITVHCTNSSFGNLNKPSAQKLSGNQEIKSEGSLSLSVKYLKILLIFQFVVSII